MVHSIRNLNLTLRKDKVETTKPLDVLPAMCRFDETDTRYRLSLPIKNY